MDKRRSLQVSDECWRKLKQRALDEGVTVREVVELAVYRYLGAQQAMGYVGPVHPAMPAEPQWTKDDDPACRSKSGSRC